MIKTSVLIQLFCFACTNVWTQGDSAINYSNIANQLKEQIYNGKKQALRDIGSLLEKKEVDQHVRKILNNATFFTSEEINIHQASKLDFLSFYYDNEQDIQFSEMLHTFYITPLEDRKINFGFARILFYA